MWVQGTLVVCYLPYIWYSTSFANSEKDVFIRLVCFAIYGYFSVFELIIKPVAASQGKAPWGRGCRCCTVGRPEK